MSQLHIFVEELSIKKVLDVILPKILHDSTFFRIHPHQGKEDLKDALRNALPTISKIPNTKIIILTDQDDEECMKVKDELENIVSGKVTCLYKIRIVCKELESWFLGDLPALKKAFPRFKEKSVQNKAKLKNVDSIPKPSNYMLKIIPEYRRTEYLPKVENAERIAPFMQIEGNNSKSFNQTINTIKNLSKNT